MLTLQIFLIISFVNVFQLKAANITNGRCETNIGNGIIKAHCCDNQEVRNGICVECEVGFVSDKDDFCKPCPTGFYGRKCGDICKCDDFEKCHHVVGCLQFSDTKLASETSTENANSSKIEHAMTGSIGKEMVIYIICTSGVTFVVTLCLVTFNRYRKKHTRNLTVNPVMVVENNENNAITLNQAHDHYYRVYDTIDESQMIDFPTQHPIPPVDSSSDTSSKDGCSLSDGYLNPYQPIVPDFERHDYLKANRLATKDSVKNTNEVGDHDTIHGLSKTDEHELEL